MSYQNVDKYWIRSEFIGWWMEDKVDSFYVGNQMCRLSIMCAIGLRQNITNIS